MTTSTADSSPSSPIASAPAARATPPATPSVRHSWIDNLQGQLFGVVMIAFGMSMLHSLGLIIGQIAGVAFLVTYATGISFGMAFTLINLPFYLLAALRMGAAFTWRTLAAVTAVSVLTNVAGNYISYSHLDPAVGAVLAPEDVISDPHLRARGFPVEVTHEDLGRTFTYPGAALRMNGSPMTIRRRAPHVGEHTDEVLGEIGYTARQIAGLRTEGAAG